MKLKENFVLSEMGDDFVVVSTSQKVDHFPGMVRLNKSGAFLFGLLQKGQNREQLIESLCQHYDVEESRAKEDVAKFLDTLSGAGLLE